MKGELGYLEIGVTDAARARTSTSRRGAPGGRAVDERGSRHTVVVLRSHSLVSTAIEGLLPELTLLEGEVLGLG